jgi:hypothetical protein
MQDWTSGPALSSPQVITHPCRLLCFFVDEEEPTLDRCRRRSIRASESLWVGIRSLGKMPGKDTYSKHNPALFLSFLFIAPNALDVISPIRVVGFVVGDAHDGKRQMCVVCLSHRPGLAASFKPSRAKFRVNK